MADNSNSQIPDKLEPKTNGHVALDKLQQGLPSGQETKAEELSIEEAMMSVVDEQQMESDIAAAVGQTVVPKAEAPPVEKKQDERLSKAASKPTEQPVEGPTQATVGESGQLAEGEEVSQVGVAEPAAVSSSPKRPVRMPLVPVNGAPEAAANGIIQRSDFDKTASTHKPLGSILKPPRSPSSEDAPQDVGTRIPAVASSDAAAEGKDAESHPVETPAGETGTTPAEAPEQTKAPTPPEDAPSTSEPPKQEPAAPQSTQAAEEERSATPQHFASPTVTEPTKDPAKSESTVEESAPAPSAKTTATVEAEFPRQSSEAQAKSPPNGTPRKKKTTLIQKIKRVFKHEGKGKK